ncbi:helix-turn-helix domain-containing protein [Bradyrhizobium paxllaeri]|uniref:AraC-like ligand-binding domain-containing protein n=1 Tax=Bradyrhizobium paxllaeri TaxID=190148 RepID=UPI0008108365|nr:helix-turn-helix domain-containing protein [Bradyrhizobium paxllaeri]
MVLDTRSCLPGRRLAVWQDIVCDTFVGLDCKSDMRGAFWGSVSQSRIGPAAFTRVDSTAQRVFRTPSRIARASEDFVLMAMGNSGVNGVFQDGREAIVSAGQFVIYDTTRPYELRFDDSFSQTILQMPRKLLQQRIGAFDGLTATTFAGDRPLERLTYDFMLNVSKTIEQVDPAAASRLLDQALDLLAMTLADRLHARLADQSAHRSALLYRLKNHILTHLADPELSLPRAAAAVGISPRYASDLMADEQTSFRGYVQTQRLERCKRDLADPACQARHIGEIAFAWGFNDLAHFSRIFRQRFGVSPREWREQPGK